MSRRAHWLIVVALGVVFVVFDVILTHNALTEPFPGHNDFLTPWEMARSYFVDGLPVYSDQANVNIQMRIYGRPIREGEFPNYFAYPFYTVFLMWPLVYLPYAWASAVWMVALEVALIAALALLLAIYRWRPRPAMLGLLVLWMLLFYPSARGLILGQVSHVVFLLQAAVIWATLRGHDQMGGLLLALATVKPQMTYLLAAFFVLWALRRRRWRFLAAFGVMMAILLGVSFLLQPTWIGDWLKEIQRYTDYTAVGSPMWVMTQYYLGLGPIGEWAANALLYVTLGWAWFVTLRRRPERFLWTVMLTLTVTHVVAPRTATTHFVVLAAPLLFYAAYLSRRWFGTVLMLLALLVLPWLHFLYTVAGEFEHPATYLPLPLATLALLWLTRRLWWREAALNAPDTFPTVSS